MLCRQRCLWKKIDEGYLYHYYICEDLYRVTYFEAIDFLVNGIRNRFDQPVYATYASGIVTVKGGHRGKFRKGI